MAILQHETTKQRVTGSQASYPRSSGWIVVKYKEVEKAIYPIPENEWKYWKVSGDDFIEMTTQEKADVDQAEIDQAAQAETDAKDFMVSGSKLYKAMGLAFLDAINTVRAEVSLPALTVDQLKTVIANKYDGLG
jgi:hypothetical protein